MAGVLALWQKHFLKTLLHTAGNDLLLAEWRAEKCTILCCLSWAPGVSQQCTLIRGSQPVPLVTKKGTTVCFMFQSKVFKRDPHGFMATKLSIPPKARLKSLFATISVLGLLKWCLIAQPRNRSWPPPCYDSAFLPGCGKIKMMPFGGSSRGKKWHYFGSAQIKAVIPLDGNKENGQSH